MVKMAALSSEQLTELEARLDDLLRVSDSDKFSLCDNSGIDMSVKLSQKEKDEEPDRGQ